MSIAQVIEEVEREQMKREVPYFRVGDQIKVSQRIVEENRERIQVFEGIVIGRRGRGMGESFALYRIAFGKAMMRVFLLHSPHIADIKVSRRGKVRRAKLYYLLGKYGKAVRIKERIEKRG